MREKNAIIHRALLHLGTIRGFLQGVFLILVFKIGRTRTLGTDHAGAHRVARRAETAEERALCREEHAAQHLATATAGRLRSRSDLGGNSFAASRWAKPPSSQTAAGMSQSRARPPCSRRRPAPSSAAPQDCPPAARCARRRSRPRAPAVWRSGPAMQWLPADRAARSRRPHRGCHTLRQEGPRITADHRADVPGPMMPSRCTSPASRIARMRRRELVQTQHAEVREMLASACSSAPPRSGRWSRSPPLRNDLLSGCFRATSAHPMASRRCAHPPRAPVHPAALRRDCPAPAPYPRRS